MKTIEQIKPFVIGPLAEEQNQLNVVQEHFAEDLCNSAAGPVVHNALDRLGESDADLRDRVVRDGAPLVFAMLRDEDTETPGIALGFKFRKYSNSSDLSTAYVNIATLHGTDEIVPLDGVSESDANMIGAQALIFALMRDENIIPHLDMRHGTIKA